MDTPKIWPLLPPAVEDVLRRHAARYPQMQPEDAVKLLFQASLGPGHRMEAEEAARQALLTELDTLTSAPALPYEEIGGGYARLYLHPAMRSSAACLAHLLVHTASAAVLPSQAKANGKSMDAALGVLASLTEEGIFSFTPEQLRPFLEAYVRAGCPIPRHSAVYHAAYAPAYRVLHRETAFLYGTLARLWEAAARKGQAVLAIDGFCAAGKSTLAATLAASLGARLFPMDDFFLPPEKRTPERLAEPGGNVDYERFQTEVLGHLRDTSLTYGVFSCADMRITHTRTLPWSRFTIVEGAYALHPFFGSYADAAVFLDVPPEEQRKRILARNGPKMLRMFTERWIPMEKTYAETFSIPKRAGERLCMTTSPAAPIR